MKFRLPKFQLVFFFAVLGRFGNELDLAASLYAQEKPNPTPTLTKSNAQPRPLPGVQSTGAIQLPNQWSLRPVGEQLELGDFPVNMALHPDGGWLAVLHAGWGTHEVVMVDIRKAPNKIASRVTLDQAFYGLCFSPDGKSVAFGCADKTVRLIGVSDGKELMKFDNHSDWVLATTFTVDGKRLLSGSRDRAMKLIDVANGQFIDDINKLLENVLCMARHPKEDIVAYGGDLGTPRTYRIAENQGRTAANNDVNMIREFERQPGPVCSVSYSPDGNSIAVGNVNGEVRLYKTGDGSKIATLKENQGAVFALKFHPTKNHLVTGGYDGKVRIFEVPEGKLLTAFYPVPIPEGAKVAAASGVSGK